MANTWYVDDNHPGTVGDGAGTAGNPFTTIAAAMAAAAASGDTIMVAAGSYNENVVVNKSVILQGAGSGVTTITGIAGAAGTIEVATNTSNVTIDGFKVVGFDGPPGIERAAIYLTGPSSNITISHNNVVANGDSGLTSTFGAVLNNIIVDSNEFSGQTFVDPPAGNGFGTQFVLPNVPRQLVVLSHNTGPGVTSNITNVTFTNNLVSGTAGGISTTDNAGDPLAAHAQGNTLVTIDASNSTVSGNTFTGFTNGGATQLRVREENTNVTNNSFSNAAGGNLGTFIDTDGAPGTVSGNTADYGAGDDYIFASAGSDLIDGGTGTDTYDMTAAGSTGTVVDLNTGYSFSSNTGFDTLVNIENAKGSAGNDVFIGNGGDNVFIATAGSDTFNGNGDGPNGDTFDASAAATAINVNLNGGTTSGAFTTNLSNVENVKTGAGNDTITLSSANNKVDAGAGVDTVNLATAPANIETGVTANGTSWTVVTPSGGTDTLTNVEIIDAGAHNILLVGSGGFATIQAAINAAQAGDTIRIAAGTYAENLTIDATKTGLTIIADDGVNVTGGFRAANGNFAGPVTTYLQNNTTGYNYTSTTGLTIDASGVTIKNLNITDAGTGIKLLSGADGLTLTGVDVSSTVYGLRKEHTIDIDHLTITGGSFSDGYIGIDFDKDATLGNAAVGHASYVTIDGTSFTDLTRKGIYAETLSHALITGVTMNNVGQWGGIPLNGPNGAGGNGINLNLKNGDYLDITIQNFTLTNTGASDKGGLGPQGNNGGAIVIESRDDATSYNNVPATLNGVTVQNGTINGHTSGGIFVGEPTKDNLDPDVTVTNVSINGAAHTAYYGDIANESSTSTMTVTGTSAGDSLIASTNSDGKFNIDGAGGNDTITTGSNNDTIKGGAGADVMDGAAGTDTAVFATTYSDAKINGVTGTFTVDVDGAGSEGTDTLTNIEKAVFADKTVWLVDSDTELSTALASAGDGDVIYLAAGTYNGNFTVSNKNVTITTNNASLAGTSNLRSDEAIINGKFLVSNSPGNPKDVTIEGVRFLNSVALGGDGELRFTGPGNFTVKNSIFYSTDPDSGQSSPTVVASHQNRAILLDTTVSGTVNVQGNLFTGSQVGKYATASWTTAIWHDGVATLNATGNTINNARTGFNLDSFNNNGSISGNTFNVVGTTFSFGLQVVGLSVIQNNIFMDTDADWNIRSATVTGVNLDLLTSNNTSTGINTNVVYGTLQADTISGSNGVDVVFGDGLSSVVNGTGDVITLRGGNDTAGGQGGNDTIDGGTGDDVIDGGAGDDSLSGGADNDSILGGAGNDSIDGGTGADTLKGGDDNDTVNGGDGNDVIEGNAGADVLNGNANNDTISGGDNNDTVNGGTGNDSISGDAGADSLSGGDDNDTISGGDGNDTIDGGSGNDSLLGGDNNDNITGGDGNDTIDAGAGTDTVVFEHAFGEYTIVYDSGTGSYSLTRDSVVDIVKGVEVFKFLDETIDVTGDPNAVINIWDPQFDGDPSVVAIAEGTSGQVYDADATDADNEDPFGPIVYSLEGADAGKFTINSTTGQIFLTNAADRETQASYSITVKATQGTTSATKALTFNVTDSNDTAPVFSSGDEVSVSENTAASVVIHTAAAADADTTGGAVTFSLLGTDSTAFTINATTGELRFNAPPDFETKNEYNFQIVAHQGSGPTTAQNFTVNVNNVIENALALSVINVSLEAGTTKTALPNVTGGTSGHTFDVASLDLDGGKLYLANGSLVTAGMTGLTLDQVNGLLLSSGSAGTSSIQFVVHLDGVEDDNLNYAIAVGAKVDGLYEGNGGANVLDGAAGNDTVKGLGGNDTLFGSSGNDSIVGSTGNDWLNGGTGKDTLNGGTGSDKFVFDTAMSAANADTIVGFTHGSDKILLSRAIFGAIGPAFTSNEFVKNTSGNAGSDDHIVYETDTGKLFYDSNSNQAGGKVLIATLDNKATLTFDDFIFIA